MPVPSRTEVVTYTFTPESDGDFTVENVFSQTSPEPDHITVSPVNGQVICAKAEYVGGNDISGRAMRASGGEILPSTNQITLTFVGYWI